jgi:hypothetical protein
LLAHGKHTGLNYKDDVAAVPGDSNEQRFMLGAKWEATAQTTGEFKLGQVQKKFNDSTYTNYNSTAWEGGLTWSPLSYLNLDFDASKKPTESTFNGARTIVVGNTGLNIGFNVNDRVTVSANGSQVKEEFIGTSRSDSTDNLGLKAEYKVRSWLLGVVEYSNAVKTSTDNTANFKRDIFVVSLRSIM